MSLEKVGYSVIWSAAFGFETPLLLSFQNLLRDLTVFVLLAPPLQLAKSGPQGRPDPPRAEPS
jgi:hypothetical protein